MYAGFPIQPLPARRTGKDCKIEIGAIWGTSHQFQFCYSRRTCSNAVQPLSPPYDAAAFSTNLELDPRLETSLFFFFQKVDASMLGCLQINGIDPGLRRDQN